MFFDQPKIRQTHAHGISGTCASYAKFKTLQELDDKMQLSLDYCYMTYNIDVILNIIYVQASFLYFHNKLIIELFIFKIDIIFFYKVDKLVKQLTSINIIKQS